MLPDATFSCVFYPSNKRAIHTRHMRRIPGALWPVSLALSASPRLVRPCVIQSKTALEEQQLRLSSGFYIHVYMCTHILSLTQSQRQLNKTPKAAWRTHFIVKRKVSMLETAGLGAYIWVLGQKCCLFPLGYFTARDLFPLKREMGNSLDKETRQMCNPKVLQFSLVPVQ